MKRAGFLLLVTMLLAACRTPDALVLREQLKADPAWPAVRRAAQAALAKHEEVATGWKTAMRTQDSGAIYPLKKEGATWLVQACDDYPKNRYGVVVEMQITEQGEVQRYTQLWKQAYEAASEVK